MTEEEVGAMLKKMQFVETLFKEHTSGWCRRFVRLVANDNQWFIGHYMQGQEKQSRLTKISTEDINEWIRYFDRI